MTTTPQQSCAIIPFPIACRRGSTPPKPQATRPNGQPIGIGDHVRVKSRNRLDAEATVIGIDLIGVVANTQAYFLQCPGGERRIVRAEDIEVL